MKEFIMRLIDKLFGRPLPTLPPTMERQILLGGFQYNWSSVDPYKLVRMFRLAGFDGLSCELNEMVGSPESGIRSREAFLAAMRKQVDKITLLVRECHATKTILKVIMLNSNNDAARTLKVGDLEGLLDYALSQWQPYLARMLILPISENDADTPAEVRRRFIQYAESKLPRANTVKMLGNEGGDCLFVETHLQHHDEIGRGLPRHWSSLAVTDSREPIVFMEGGGQDPFYPARVNPANCRYIAERNWKAGYSFELYWFASANDQAVSQAVTLVGALTGRNKP